MMKNFQLGAAKKKLVDDIIKVSRQLLISCKIIKEIYIQAYVREPSCSLSMFSIRFIMKWNVRKVNFGAYSRQAFSRDKSVKQASSDDCKWARWKGARARVKVGLLHVNVYIQLYVCIQLFFPFNNSSSSSPSPPPLSRSLTLSCT